MIKLSMDNSVNGETGMPSKIQMNQGNYNSMENPMSFNKIKIVGSSLMVGQHTQKGG